MSKKNIESIIRSSDFHKELEVINENFPNLKQENQIRNAIVKLYNLKYGAEDEKAFAEHPKENGKARDLSIVNSRKTILEAEFKFHFTSDFKNVDNLCGILCDLIKQIKGKRADIFILIVQQFLDKNDKRNFDEKWRISTKLDQHQNEILNNSCCSKILDTIFKELKKNIDAVIKRINDNKEDKYKKCKQAIEEIGEDKIKRVVKNINERCKPTIISYTLLNSYNSKYCFYIFDNCFK